MRQMRPKPVTPPRLRRQTALGASLRKVLALPRWVFRSLSVLGCSVRAAALERVVPDLRPHHAHLDLRYDI